MPLDQEAIDQQQTLLGQQRQRLARLFEQQAKLGAQTPPQVVIDIRKAQDAIASIKATLRAGGALVEDAPNDTAPPAAVAAQAGASAETGPRVQSTVTVQDNQGSVTRVQFNQPGWSVTGPVYNVAGNLNVGDQASFPHPCTVCARRSAIS